MTPALVVDPAGAWPAVLQRMARAARLCGLGDELLELIATPERALEVAVPLRLDDGDLEVYTGWRVHHDTAGGPGKGGVRFHHALSLDEVKALAATMTVQHALVRLPFGGAHGGVRCDPRALTASELQRLTRGYTVAVASMLGADLDVTGPDVGTDPTVLGWLLDTLRIVGRRSPAAVTGKPVALGGGDAHSGATSVGILDVTRATFRALDRPLAGARAVIQGFGKVGGSLAYLLTSVGLRVVAVSDAGGAVAHPGGIDPAALAEHIEEAGTVAGFAGADKVDSDDLWSIDCDLLVPAALGGAITASIAERVRAATVVVEAAVGATSVEAQAVLAERGVVVVPDILANAGGVIDGWLEWEQSQSGRHQQREDAPAIRGRVEEAFGQVTARADGLSLGLTGLRPAAWAVAMERIAAAHTARSVFP